ncbi:hypothetical protein Efla_005467 [Eimeria flavescens]
MSSKSEYLKKYLRAKGPPRQGGPPKHSGRLKLGSDDEPDARLERKRRGAGEGKGAGSKSLFQVLRRAPGGGKFVFRDAEAEELPDSDEEEVRVVGEDGQTLVLSEADKKKVAELISKEEGRDDQGGQLAAVPERDDAFEAIKEAFAFGESSGVIGQSERTALVRACSERGSGGQRDLSPSRRRQESQQRDLSPPNRRKESQQRDLSPPRQRQGSQQRALSPPRRRQEPQQGDLSPPRRRHESQQRDLSPPRRRQGFQADGRLLSLQEASQARDLSPPRRRQEHQAVPRTVRGEDFSPARLSRDLSPARGFERGNGEGGASSGDALNSKARDLSPWRRGEISQREAQRASDAAAPTSKNIIFRDREGRIISEEEWLTLEGAKGRRKGRERGPAPVLEWGSGLKQKEDRKSKKQQEEKLAQAPFARYEIDEEYDAALKARDRWADPLVKVASSTRIEREAEQDGAATEEGGIQQRPTCPHDAPPNRFNIKPGYRWDGVVRGNGYEEERLKVCWTTICPPVYCRRSQFSCIDPHRIGRRISDVACEYKAALSARPVIHFSVAALYPSRFHRQ